MDPFTIVAIVGIILGSLIVLFTIGNAIRLHMMRSKASSPSTKVTVDTPLNSALYSYQENKVTEECAKIGDTLKGDRIIYVKTSSTSEGLNNPDSITPNFS